MSSDFLRPSVNPKKPISYLSASSFQQNPTSLHIPYPIYEKSPGKDVLPSHTSNSKQNHTYSSNKGPSMSKYTTKDPNSISGIGNFDFLLSNVTIKHESPSVSLLIDDTTDKEIIDRSFCLPSQQLSDHYYMPRPSGPRSRNSVTAASSKNHFQAIGVKPEKGTNLTSCLDSYGQNGPSTGIYDESGSTKDNSMNENNLVYNHTFLKNLENLTTLLNDPNKGYRPIIQTKYQSTGNNSNTSMSAAHKSNEIQNIQQKGGKGIKSSNIQTNISRSGSNSALEKNQSYHHQQSAYSSYGTTSQTSSQSQLSKGRSTSALQTRRDAEMTKSQRNSHQQSQRDKSYNAGTARQDNDESMLVLNNAPGPRADSFVIQQKEDTRYQTRNSHQHMSQDSSKSLPMHRVLKDTLISGGQFDHSRYSDSQSGTQHSSVNMGYNLNNSRLNYGQIKLDADPVDDFTDSMMKRNEYSLHQKPYWQLKKTSAKLEASKKDLIHSLMKNSYIHPNFKNIYGIEGNSKLSNPANRGTHNYKKSHENIETTQKNSSSRRDTHNSSNDGISVRNIDKRPALNNRFLGAPSSAAEVRNAGRKDIKSMDMKRSLSGKLNIKTGDEPGKENAAVQKSTTKIGSHNSQIIQKIDSNAKTPSAKQKVLQTREKTPYTIEESGKKEDKDANLKFIPQLLRGRTLSKYRESPDDDDYSPATSFDLANQASSKSFTYSKPEQMRPFSESRSNSKDILTSLKDFSYGVVKSTKDFFLHKYTNQKARAKCKCVSSARLDSETCPKAQKWLFSKYKESELDYLRKTYEKIRDSPDIDPRCNKQIKLDLKRTYPECEFFASNSEGLLSLEKVLECYAKYDPKIGYVQGMNFIAASILYHAEEYIAFWILVLIFEKSEMRDVYMQDLPGLAKHSQIVDFLILNNLPELYSHFCTHNITVEMFCTEWIFGLFGSVIPVEKMDCFLDGFVDQGWLFFYKFVLALLKSFEKELLEASDMSEILIIFKSGINKRERNVFTGGKEKVEWEKLVKYAYQIVLDNSFIHKMLMVFDQETKRFLLNSK